MIFYRLPKIPPGLELTLLPRQLLLRLISLHPAAASGKRNSCTYSNFFQSKWWKPAMVSSKKTMLLVHSCQQPFPASLGVAVPAYSWLPSQSWLPKRHSSPRWVVTAAAAGPGNVTWIGSKTIKGWAEMAKFTKNHVYYIYNTYNIVDRQLSHQNYSVYVIKIKASIHIIS